MSQVLQPLVSVVTPVYNGEKYLRECIESVLAQTFGNFEFIIANNCSKDQTLAIAQSYAKDDPRIRVIDSTDFVGAIENSNRALQWMNDQSVYCKVLHADDWMFPDCLEKMVALAEAHPNVGVVASYVLSGRKVQCDGLPYTDSVLSGQDICKDRLLGGPYLFGSPSSILIRSEIVRGRVPFYPQDSLHVDVAVLFEILKDWDFGFVHQVLTYTRLHEESRTSTIAKKLNTNRLEGLGMLTRYGPDFLSQEELQRACSERLRTYYEALVRQHLRLLDPAFRDYQRQALDQIGYRFSPAELARAAGRLLLGYLMRPLRKMAAMSRPA